MQTCLEDSKPSPTPQHLPSPFHSSQESCGACLGRRVGQGQHIALGRRRQGAQRWKPALAKEVARQESTIILRAPDLRPENRDHLKKNISYML